MTPGEPRAGRGVLLKRTVRRGKGLGQRPLLVLMMVREISVRLSGRMR
jgi:hypothetical protein